MGMIAQQQHWCCDVVFLGTAPTLQQPVLAHTPLCSHQQHGTWMLHFCALLPLKTAHEEEVEGLLQQQPQHILHASTLAQSATITALGS